MRTTVYSLNIGLARFMWIINGNHRVPVIPNGSGVRLVNTPKDNLLLCSVLDLVIAARREGLYPEKGIEERSSPHVIQKEMEVVEGEGRWLPTTWDYIVFGGSSIDLDYHQRTVDQTRNSLM